MGACNSSESRSAGQVSNSYKLAGRTSQRKACNDEPTIPESSEHHVRISDGAIENHAVHDGAILGIASAGMKEFVTCGEDKTLRLYGLVDRRGTFRNSCTFTGHTKAGTRATYGAKTRLLYSCSRDTTIRQWNRSDTTALRVFEGHDLACTAVALSEDETILWSGSRDTSVRAWDVHTGQCTSSAKIPRNLVTCLKHLSADSSSSSSVVAQGGEDLRLRVWDAREQGLRPSLTIEGYTFFPLCLDATKDGHQLLTSCKGFNGEGCETKLWDLRNTGTPLRQYTGHTQDTTACVFIEPHEGPCQGERRGGDGGGGGRSSDAGDGYSTCRSRASFRMIATASKDGTIKIYNLATGNVIADRVEPDCGGYTGLALAPHHDPNKTGCQCPILYASTITGGLYTLQLEAVGGPGGGNGEQEGVQLRCLGFVRGSPIL